MSPLIPNSQFVPVEMLEGPTVEISETSRRRFLSLMAGSLALAGLTGCTRQPTETILPYVDQPENVIPGRPKYYATAINLPGGAQGVIVESHLGRPTKVEGNPNHPASLGASSVQAQASLMDLYDPDRAKDTTCLGLDRTWEDFLDVAQSFQGKRISILTETVISPSLGSQIKAVLRAYPGSKWHQWEPAAAPVPPFEKPLNTIYNFADAAVVLSLDSDFLACGPASTRYAHDFAARRRQGNRLDMNRLYVVESTMTATGGKADHRLGVRYSEVETIALSLQTQAFAGNYQAWVQTALQDIQANAGRSIVIPGDHQSAAVHVAAHRLNAALGNVGKTVFYTEPIAIEAVDQLASLRELIGDLNAGQIDVLLILGGNPVYNTPADLDFSHALEKARLSVHAASHWNETSRKSTWHIPEPHSLEDWGDTRSFDGTISIIQPLILPLYNSRSHLTVLDAVLKAPGRSSYEVLREYWRNQSGVEDFEAWWRKSVHDGVVANSALSQIQPSAIKTVTPPASQSMSGLELVFRPNVYMHDGRYANNIWLQELPQPMTKLTWDNAVYLSPATAKRLEIDNQQPVRLELAGRTVEGSVWILPGHPDETVTIDLGYGRTQSGRAGNGAGFNAYLLRTSDAMWVAHGVKLRKLNKAYPLATTQPEAAMQHRDVVIHNTLDGYKHDPDFVQLKEHQPPENLTLYPHWNYNGYAWSMSIDLTACVNCQACVVACQAENNIPVVGKEQVLARRAMHWLRIDVYYEDGYKHPAAHYAPIPCMQCENAPCELVCPVQATNHSSEGLNDMVYNRCVGTRYCSNNCPWKVRRFNFLLFQDWATETYKMQRNPDVSVRSRGVMEKCTYCVQRIREAEINSENNNRSVRDGEIKTACQQACPTEAIIFGDKNNSNNRVAKLKAEKLNYAMYSELNTRPRTTYLAELRNPHPGLKEGTAE